MCHQLFRECIDFDPHGGEIRTGARGALDAAHTDLSSAKQDALKGVSYTDPVAIAAMLHTLT